MGIIEKEKIGDFKREEEVTKGYENRSNLSLEDRLRLMWRQDAYGRLSPELEQAQNTGQFTLFIGAFGGYMVGAKNTFDKFVVENKHEMFKSPRHAQDVLRKDMMKFAARNAMYWGFKLTFICTTYCVSTLTMNAVQNNITGHGHAACGFVLGSLFRVIQGPRQMLAAGCIGAPMGFVEGVSQKGLIWLRDGSYENHMLRRYNEFQAERTAYLSKVKDEQKELIDKWRETEVRNSNEEHQDKSRILAKAIITFFREYFGTDRYK